MTQAVRSKRERIARDLELFVLAFPAVFRSSKESRMRHPLKIGIREDILALGLLDQDEVELSRRRVDQALYAYTNHACYHLGLTKMRRRFGLDGRPAGDVDDVSRIRAARLLAEARKRRSPRPAPRLRARPNRTFEARV